MQLTYYSAFQWNSCYVSNGNESVDRIVCACRSPLKPGTIQATIAIPASGCSHTEEKPFVPYPLGAK